MTKARVTRLWLPAVLLAGILLGAFGGEVRAQSSGAGGQGVPPSTRTLLDKANAQQARGQMDLAVRTWAQVLLTEPNNAEALGALARAARRKGEPQLAETYETRLRQASANDVPSAYAALSPDRKAKLERASKLADAGEYAAAMAIYRQVFGAHPPPGDWALAYYETEAATDGGRSQAEDGLRMLVEKYPDEPRYKVLLGRVLTYDPATREEGRKYLAKFPGNSQAAQALRQSLLWDAANPAVAPQIRAYLAEHADAQLAAVFQLAQPAAAKVDAAAAVGNGAAASLAASSMPIVVTPARTGVASSVPGSSSSQPAPGPAAVAEEKGAVSPSADAAAIQPAAVTPSDAGGRASARSGTAAEVAAYQALNANRIDEAESRFKAILDAAPHDGKALAGMGYVRMQQGNFPGAIPYLEQANRIDADDKGLATALDTARFWNVMGEAHRAFEANDLTTAETRYRAALAVRPDNAEAREGLGATLLKAQQPGEDNAAARQSLARLQHATGHDRDAPQTVESAPPATYTTAMRAPGFAVTVAAADDGMKKLDVAQALLQRAVTEQTNAGQKPSAAIEMQLANIYTERGKPQLAYPVYQQVLHENPGRADAWAGLLSALHVTGHDKEAVAQIELIPVSVRTQLQANQSYVQTMAEVVRGASGSTGALTKSQSVAAADGYSPFVPYVAPVPSATRETSYRPGSTSAGTVQLGNDAPPPVQAQAEVAEVLPTPRYTGAMQNSQHTAEPQIRRPASPPAGTGSAPDIGTQQYPQPVPRPRANGSTIARSRPVQRAAVPARTRVETPKAPTSGVVASAPSAVPAVPPVAPAAETHEPSRVIAQGNLAVAPASAVPAAPTDAELGTRALLAPGGSDSGVAATALTQQKKAEDELALLGSYSGWLGVTGIARYRSGTPGLDRLYDLESPVEASFVMGRQMRLTVVAEPVFLNSGTLNPADFLGANVPYLGTMALDAANLPARQFFNGVGGEVQFAAKSFAVAVGYAPYEFPVRNVTGHFVWNGIGNHVSLFGDREPVKDTLLSYVGLHDPGAAVPSAQSSVWGGVVASTGGVRLQFGETAANFFVAGEGGILTGQHVLDNYRYKGTAGAAFRLHRWTDGGELRLGAELTGMHYQHDEAGLSYGQGGYFSPDTYFAVLVPLRFEGHYGSNFHYMFAGSIGGQKFQQNVALFYPLDPGLQFNLVSSKGAACMAAQMATYNCGEYPLIDSTQFSYAFRSEASYRFGGHWYGGVFVFGDNSSNFDTVSAGFFFRYVFRSQHSREGYPAGLFQVDGLRPLQIP
jgi:tetratricopeptide (TPR) repeat protein